MPEIFALATSEGKHRENTGMGYGYPGDSDALKRLARSGSHLGSLRKALGLITATSRTPLPHTTGYKSRLESGNCLTTY